MIYNVFWEACGFRFKNYIDIWSPLRLLINFRMDLFFLRNLSLTFLQGLHWILRLFKRTLICIFPIVYSIIKKSCTWLSKQQTSVTVLNVGNSPSRYQQIHCSISVFFLFQQKVIFHMSLCDKMNKESLRGLIRPWIMFKSWLKHCSDLITFQTSAS